MDAMEVFHPSKRKQECLNNETVYQSTETEPFNTKKQRLSDNYFEGNDGIPLQFPEIFNGHTPVNGCEQATKSSVVGGKAGILGNISEPMECTDEVNGNNVEVNGSEPAVSSKLCPHGHVNTCTTYNVPCRYPRMYCHPGGIMEDRLRAYHGI